MQTEIVYGAHPVIEALKAGRREFFEVFIAREKRSERLEEIAAMAESLDIPVRRVDSHRIGALSGAPAHQGVCAKTGPYPLAALSDVLPLPADSGKKTFLIFADGIEDPQNLGALARTALCAGADGIVIPKDRAAPPTPAASKASAGALEHLAVVRVTNLARTVSDVKEAGLWIFGADRSGERTIFSCNLTGPLALVLGGEEKGIRPLVKAGCDFLVSIPQVGTIGSLNVSVAAGVLIYEVFRQRGFLGAAPYTAR